MLDIDSHKNKLLKLLPIIQRRKWQFNNRHNIANIFLKGCLRKTINT